MLEKKHEGKNFLIGTLVGGLVGTATALLLAPKSGSKLRQDLLDKYSEVSDSLDWDTMMNSFQEPEEPSKGKTNLLLGGVAGSLLGAVAALMLAPKSGRALRRDLTDKCQELSENSYAQQICEMNPFQRTTKRKSLLGQRRK